MKTAPLLSVLMALSPSVRAGAQPANPPPAKLTAQERTYLDSQGFDPKFVSPDAFKAADTDPSSFVRENRKTYDRFVSWRQDPDLLLSAARKDRVGVERDLDRMATFLSPEQVGLLQANLRLAPHDMNARVPEGSGFEGGRGAPSPLAASPVVAASPRSSSVAGTSAAAFRPGPTSLTTSAPPFAAPRENPPPKEKPWWQDSLDYYYCLLYPDRC